MLLMYVPLIPGQPLATGPDVVDDDGEEEEVVLVDMDVWEDPEAVVLTGIDGMTLEVTLTVVVTVVTSPDTVVVSVATSRPITSSFRVCYR